MCFRRVYCKGNVTVSGPTALRFVTLIFIIIGQYAEPTPESTSSKHLKAMTADAPWQGKVALVCRDQSDIAIIRDWFGDELLGKFITFSGSPDAGPNYLLSITLMRSCIIVVDASAMKDELCRRSAKTPYIDLLNNIRGTVGKISVLNLFHEGLSQRGISH